MTCEFDNSRAFVGHCGGHAAVILGERIRVEVRVDLLRDRDAGVAEDLGELEDVSARREEQTGEGVSKIVKAELPRQPSADHSGLERALSSFCTSPADCSQRNGRSATSRSRMNLSGVSEHQPCSMK